MTQAIAGTIVRTIAGGRDIRFFVYDREDAIQRHHLKGEFYEREELEIMTQFWRTDRAFVDIGANVGNHAIYASKVLHTPKVIVFECNPFAAELLRINLLLNDLNDRVDTRFLGVALGPGEGRVRVVEDPRGNNLGGAGVADDEEGDIRMVAGDTLLAGESIGFIKIDVEGMEMEVLAGLQATIARWRPHMFIEVMDRNRDAFAAWVEASGYWFAGSAQRYEGLINYVVMPGKPQIAG